MSRPTLEQIHKDIQEIRKEFARLRVLRLHILRGNVDKSEQYKSLCRLETMAHSLAADFVRRRDE